MKSSGFFSTQYEKSHLQRRTVAQLNTFVFFGIRRD
jgi:hypothetical protein